MFRLTDFVKAVEGDVSSNCYPTKWESGAAETTGLLPQE